MPCPYPEVPYLLASWATLNTQILVKTNKSHTVLSKFTILCWATFIATLGCIGLWAMGWTTLGGQ